MRKRMFEVPHGQDPYNAIGKYIRDHMNIIEDVIAVIEIDAVETNQLFMVDMHEDGYFIWKSDWYEGEEKVVLMDFFPVSEAINSSAQPEPQWIPVTKKAHPDLPIRVQVQMNNGWIITAYWDETDWFSVPDWDEIGCPIEEDEYHKIIAWRELPEPYKERREE